MALSGHFTELEDVTGAHPVSHRSLADAHRGGQFLAADQHIIKEVFVPRLQCYLYATGLRLGCLMRNIFLTVNARGSEKAHRMVLEIGADSQCRGIKEIFLTEGLKGHGPAAPAVSSSLGVHPQPLVFFIPFV